MKFIKVNASDYVQAIILHDYAIDLISQLARSPDHDAYQMKTK